MVMVWILMASIALGALIALGWSVTNYIRRVDSPSPVSATPTVEQAKNPNDVRGKKSFWMSVLVVYGALSAAGLVLLATGNIAHKIPWVGIKLELNMGATLFMLLLTYTLLSLLLKSVGTTEVGVKKFFGRILYEVPSGIAFIPLGLCELQTDPKTVVSMEIPADPEKIFRNEDKEKVPEGMFPPIRITFNKDATGKDPLNARVTAEVVPIIRFRIGSYSKFLSTVGSLEAVRGQVTDFTVAFLFEELPKISVAAAMQQAEVYNAKFLELVKSRIEQWGLEVDDAKIKVINLHHALNQAIGEIAKEQAAAEAADATKEKERKLGEGQGAKEKAILEGRAAGLKKMMDDLGVSGETVVGAEAGREIAKSAKTILAGAGNGIADLATAALVLNEIREERPSPANKSDKDNKKKGGKKGKGKQKEEPEEPAGEEDAT